MTPGVSRFEKLSAVERHDWIRDRHEGDLTPGVRGLDVQATGKVDHGLLRFGGEATANDGGYDGCVF